MGLVPAIFIYIITSIVPAKSTQLRLQIESNKPNKKTITECKRSEGKWVVTESVKDGASNKGLKFYFKGEVLYVKDAHKTTYEKVVLSDKVKIIPNHKKWRKVTQVIVKRLEKNKQAKPLMFHVVKKNKNSRVIRLDPTSYPDLAKELGKVHVNWK